MHDRPTPQQYNRAFWLLALLLAFFALGSVPDALAAGADELAKQAEALVRSAERDMYSGKNEQADAALAEANALIDQVKTADPANKRLKRVEFKYVKVREALDRKLKAAGTTTAASQTTSAPDAEKPAGGKLPAGVTKRLGEIEGYLEQTDAALSGGGSDEDRMKKADYRLRKAQELLVEIDRNYGNQVDPDQPDYLAAKQAVAEREAAVEAIRATLLAQQKTEEAQRRAAASAFAPDKVRVESLYGKYYDRLQNIHGNSLIDGNDPLSAQRALDTLDAIEQQVFPELQPALAELAARYGTHSGDIDNGLFAQGIKGESDFANQLERLLLAAQNVPASRAASAEDVARSARLTLDHIDFLVPEIRVKKLQETKSQLQLGQQLDPNNSDINGMLATIDQRMDAVAQKIETDIDSKTWAGNVQDFPGPGTVQGLSQAALDYLRNDRDWGKSPGKQVEVLKVAVRGPWSVAERDVLGRVTRWRLPIHVAVTDPAKKADNVAKVFELSIVCMEGAGDNAPKQPPFDGFWVGNNWMMRLDRL